MCHKFRRRFFLTAKQVYESRLCIAEDPVDDLHWDKSGKAIRVSKLSLSSQFCHEQTVTGFCTTKKSFSC